MASIAFEGDGAGTGTAHRLLVLWLATAGLGALVVAIGGQVLETC